MKRIVVIATCLLLAACPSQQRVYVHNKSKATLVINNQFVKGDTTISPRSTKYVLIDRVSKSCLQVSIDGEETIFYVPMTMWNASKSKRYGGRLDVYYEYGRFHFEQEDGRWYQLEETAECTAVM